jgi:rRNA maturation protein Nop10
LNDTCPRCGSKKVIPNLPISLEVWTHGGPGSGEAVVKVGGDPHTWGVSKGQARGGLTMSVCGECGHAELRVSNFRALYEKHEQSSQS